MKKDETMSNGSDTWTVNVDGVKETFTRQNVRDYFEHGRGVSGFRAFGPVSGDWRMIDRIAEDARDHFDMDEEEDVDE